MSEINYISDILEILQINDVSHLFVPYPFSGTDSCILKKINNKGIMTMYIHLKSKIDVLACPHCGTVDHHISKGTRSIELKHFSFGTIPVVLIVSYHRYMCRDCSKYFAEDIPFQFDNRKATVPNIQSALFEFRENHSMASISRQHGLGSNTMYRIFSENISVPPRYYQLSPVISIDEFRATSDKGIYAFNIVDPVSGKTLDIIEDRKASFLREYFLRFPYSQRKKVRIIIMDLSGAFRSVMHSLFPNAQIICDRFHYVRLAGQNFVQARLDACLKLDNESLARSIKRHSRLFYKYYPKLDDEKEWYDYHLKTYFTCRSYIDYLKEMDNTVIEELIENYNIYQNLLKLIHEKHSNYKEELNTWLDHIFSTKNSFFEITAKNFRKNWFMPLVCSLSYTVRYKRGNRSYKTSYNNGFIEGMNNKIKLIKRNAHGFRYFDNLRKRILMHLGYSYEFTYKKGLTISR